MSGAERLARGLETARVARAEIGREVREARLNAGLSQLIAARAVRMSHAQLGRIERGEIRGLTVDQAARACAAVGLKLVVRAYPDAEPIRDAAHVALLGRFRSLLPAGVGWQTEVPLPNPRDLRAWDAQVAFSNGLAAVEAETRLRDVQALERRMGLKQRDGDVDLVILLVNDTAPNRRALRSARASLRTSFPLDGRAILEAIRAGHAPPGSGILVL